MKVPTSDYPSTDAHPFRLVFFFFAAKWNPFPARDMKGRKRGERKLEETIGSMDESKKYARIFSFGNIIIIMILGIALAFALNYRNTTASR